MSLRFCVRLCEASLIDPWWQTRFCTRDLLVTYVDLSEDLEREARALEFLDASERARAQRNRSQETRRQFILCRAALRNKLSEVVGCGNSTLHFTSVRNEKPVALVDGTAIDIEFNVSHTVGHGLLAFANQGRLGVDIEHRHVRHDVDGEIRKVFSIREQQALKAVDGVDRVELFLRLWTIKEALIKATGEGFRAETADFTLPEDYILGAKCFHSRFDYKPSVEWRLMSLDTDQYVAALAHEML